jgi:pimeloyl-ACP methyl ester carboxylesterase
LVKRRFATVNGRQVHYRRVGLGQPLVLYPDAPRSSGALLDTLARLKDSFACLAIDPPGYGLSEPLGTDLPEVDDYARALTLLLDELVDGPCILYGEGAGACVVLETARREPDRVASVVVRGLPAFTPEEREDLAASYTPPFNPTADGSHLAGHWFLQRNERLFWPWYRQAPDARLNVTIVGPQAAEELNAAVLDQLAASPHYSLAYQATFRYNTTAALAEVTVPTTAIAVVGDRLETHLARFAPWTSRRVVERIEHAFADRNQTAKPGVLRDPVEAAPAPGRITKTFADTSYGQLLARRRADILDARPLVLLHPSPVSAAVLEPLVDRLGRTRPAVALDTLGAGDSDKPPPDFPDDVWLGDFATITVEAIESLGFKELDLYGAHTGAKIALETALLLGDRVHNVILDGFGFFDDETARDIVANFQDISPRWDGTHLLSVWLRATDANMWFPWYQRDPAHARPTAPPPPERLQSYVLEFLKSGSTYGAAYLPAYTYPSEERLGLLRHRTLLCAAADDVNRPIVDRAAALLSDAAVVELPADLDATAALLARFLDGEAVA